MKKSIVLLLSFCFMFCVICTACAKIPSQNAGESKSTSDTKATSDLQSTDGTQSSSSEDTSKSTATSATEHNGRIYDTKVVETKALATEVPALQEKVDRNHENQGSRKYQQKVIVQIGDQRDVPCIIEMGGGLYLSNDGIHFVYPTPNFSAVNISNLQKNEEYMPTYIYTGTEEFTIERNDKEYSTDYAGWSFTAISCDGYNREGLFHSFEEMHKALPTGKYYIYFTINSSGNVIVDKNGSWVEMEYKIIAPAFILDLQSSSK